MKLIYLIIAQSMAEVPEFPTWMLDIELNFFGGQRWPRKLTIADNQDLEQVRKINSRKWENSWHKDIVQKPNDYE